MPPSPTGKGNSFYSAEDPSGESRYYKIANNGRVVWISVFNETSGKGKPVPEREQYELAGESPPDGAQQVLVTTYFSLGCAGEPVEEVLPFTSLPERIMRIFAETDSLRWERYAAVPQGKKYCQEEALAAQVPAPA